MIGWLVLTSIVFILILIMQYNISPETLLDQRHPSVNVDKILSEEVTFEMFKDYAVCANGAMYRKDIKGFLPELMEKMYNERVIFKKKMIEAKKSYEKTEDENVGKRNCPLQQYPDGKEDLS